MLTHMCSRIQAGAMNLRPFIKLRLGLIITVVLVVNLICLVSLSLQGAFTWRASQKYHQDQLAWRMDQYHTIEPVTAKHVEKATDNPKAKLKVAEMKKELNDSQLTNEAMYPAKRIGRYLLLDPNLCKGVDRVDIVIIVHTAPNHLEKRQRIRDSFAAESSFYPFQIRVAFLLGKTPNKTLERVLWMEHARYNDTVMGDFMDHYHNLSLKGVMGYRWVSQHCANSKFVLKIDDDVLINMFKLLYSFLGHMNGKTKSIFCNLWHKGTMPILRTGKWKVDSHVFSSRTTFPYDYCSGFVVIMTSDLMGPMYQAAMTTPFFWIDDVYLFGMLPSVVGGVTYYNYALDRNMTLNDKVAINCTQTQGPRCPIFATYIADSAYWSYWDMIKGIYTSNTWKVENKIVN